MRRVGWMVVVVAACVGPYPDPTTVRGPGANCVDPPSLEADLIDAFNTLYCDQLDQCSPGAACSPPDLAPLTGPCTVDDQAAKDCLCGAWSCDADPLSYPAACDGICQ